MIVFNLFVVATPIIPSWSYAVGVGLGPIVYSLTPVNVTLHQIDALGQSIQSLSPSINVTIGCSTLSSSSTCSFTPNFTQLIPFTVDVLANGVHIPGSPYQVTVLSMNKRRKKEDYILITVIIDLPQYISCSGWGDPHISSFNNNQFSFQGYGEYLLYTDESGLLIQARLAQCSFGATCITAV